MSSASEENSIIPTCSNFSKRSSTLRLRPSALNTPAHVMTPTNLSAPWSPCQMSWTMQPLTGGVVEFSGQPSNSLLSKRKAESIEPYVKSKKVLTEDKMAEHLDGLHISSDFTSHSTQTFEDCSSDSVFMESEASTSSTEFSLPSSQDLEQKIRTAQRITICEQIRKLQNEPAIPHAILSRFERPCTALVLWQPPPKANELCVQLSQRHRKLLEEEHDNNNSLSIDLNNSMELDL